MKSRTTARTRTVGWFSSERESLACNPASAFEVTYTDLLRTLESASQVVTHTAAPHLALPTVRVWS